MASGKLRLLSRARRIKADKLLRAHRKYLRVATDSEEVLAFLLGELVKDRSRYLTLKNAGKQPASVSIKITDFEARVSLHSILHALAED